MTWILPPMLATTALLAGSSAALLTGSSAAGAQNEAKTEPQIIERTLEVRYPERRFEIQLILINVVGPGKEKKI